MRFLLKLLAFLAIVAAGAYRLHGGFMNIQVTEGKVGPYNFAYITHIGDYADTGRLFPEVRVQVELDGYKAGKNMGIYYDDPAITPKEQLRSDVGTLIIGHNELMLTQDYQIREIPERDSIIIDFPFQSTLSIFIGAMRVYPVMNAYMEQNNLDLNVPRIELYDPENKVIRYIAEKKTLAE